jgi:hypothetical protein
MCKFTSHVTELFPLQSNMYFKYWSPLRLMFQRQFQVYTDNCLIILNYIIDIKHIEDTNYKQGDLFFFILYLQILNGWFLNLHGRLYEKSCHFKKVNKVRCLLTRWLLPLNPPYWLLYTGPPDLRCCFLSLQSGLNIIAIQINVHSSYRVILRYWSWTSSIGENRRENVVIEDW